MKYFLMIRIKDACLRRKMDYSIDSASGQKARNSGGFRSQHTVYADHFNTTAPQNPAKGFPYESLTAGNNYPHHLSSPFMFNSYSCLLIRL